MKMFLFTVFICVLDPLYTLSSERDHAQATVQSHLLHDEMVGVLTVFKPFLQFLFKAKEEPEAQLEGFQICPLERASSG